MRGLVSCTGIDYCPFAQVDTKTTALQTAQALENRLLQAGVNPPPLTIHWSGCPNACGNPTVADIGILGKKPAATASLLKPPIYSSATALTRSRPPPGRA